MHPDDDADPFAGLWPGDAPVDATLADAMVECPGSSSSLTAVLACSFAPAAEEEAACCWHRGVEEPAPWVPAPGMCTARAVAGFAVGDQSAWSGGQRSGSAATDPVLGVDGLHRSPEFCVALDKHHWQHAHDRDGDAPPPAPPPIARRASAPVSSAVHTGAGATDGSTSTSTRAKQPGALHVGVARTRKWPKVRRPVATQTALRLFYIPVDMHRQLGLGDMSPKRASGRRSCSSVIQVTTAAGASCPVTLKCTTFKGRPHRRLAAGWREFCEAAGVRVGDTLTFARGRRVGHLVVSIDRLPPMAGACRAL